MGFASDFAQRPSTDKPLNPSQAHCDSPRKQQLAKHNEHDACRYCHEWLLGFLRPPTKHDEH
jgi:hypothetical protein